MYISIPEFIFLISKVKNWSFWNNRTNSIKYIDQ